MVKKRTPKKRKADSGTRLTINVQKIARECTTLNIGRDALVEMREYAEWVVLPKLMSLAEQCARNEQKKTIQERDMIRAKDWMNTVVMKL